MSELQTHAGQTQGDKCKMTLRPGYSLSEFAWSTARYLTRYYLDDSVAAELLEDKVAISAFGVLPGLKINFNYARYIIVRCIWHNCKFHDP